MIMQYNDKGILGGRAPISTALTEPMLIQGLETFLRKQLIQM